MNSDHDPDPRAGGQWQPDDLLDRSVADLQQRIAQALEASPPPPAGAVPDAATADVAALVAELEVAFEELRVADDELRAQQEHVDALSEVRRRLRDEHEMVLAALPVPAVVTDAHGVVRFANQAAAALAQSRTTSLVGKPIFVLFDLEGRSQLRGDAARHHHDGEPFRRRAEVLTRHGSRVPVEVSAAPLPGLRPLVCWMLVRDVGRASLSAPTGHQLPGVLVRLAALPPAHDTLQELLSRAVVLCQVALGQDVDVSVSIGSPSHPAAVASTDAVAQRLDGVQLAHEEGPCVDAYDQSVTIVSEDVRTDPRWPGISAEVPGVVGAVVATSLTSDGRRIGALNAYRSRTGSDLPLVETTELLAAALGAVLHEFDLKSELRATAAGMQTALDTRAVIDQAKGIVMAERSCTADEAFAHLVRLASQREVKVRDIAQMIVQQHTGGA